ncbi:MULTISPECIES: hypothetical protein [Amycolatopsis]|uniref:Secreted protein n=1 Tax=Amycolatopsis tucumanensis TaxID=401106 RepID=A0ABP7HW65_9PSEU|nr:MULTISPECIES: hypothetical protein [Amycolatopsis]MCF6422545.1 hypothetical protein [Amycolatopsis tucumanensis]
MKKSLALLAAAAAVVVLPGTATAAEGEPALVHASPQNGCKLNIRAAADVGSALLHTLTCTNYTTCVHAPERDLPCGQVVTGGQYTCVGAEGKQLTDNRWAEVLWRSPQQSFVAVGCAAFRS